MSPKFKERLGMLAFALFCTVLAAALIAMWLMAILMEDFNASEGLGLAVGRITFAVSLYWLLRQWLIDVPLVNKTVSVIYNTVATAIRRWKAKRCLERWFVQYRAAKARAAIQPYYETRF